MLEKEEQLIEWILFSFTVRLIKRLLIYLNVRNCIFLFSCIEKKCVIFKELERVKSFRFSVVQ